MAVIVLLVNNNFIQKLLFASHTNSLKGLFNQFALFTAKLCGLVELMLIFYNCYLCIQAHYFI